MTEYRHGDKIRVVYDATVRAGGTTASDPSGNVFYFADADEVVLVERARPSAGDVLDSGQVRATNFPAGTLIRGVPGGHHLMWTGDRWFCDNGEAVAGHGLYGGWRVCYIPDPA